MKRGGRIVVLGAGPTGLGAAHRLAEHGHRDFDVYEATGGVGGLARSHRDLAGFLWDMGGHVQFSHYAYFDQLMDKLLPDGWIEHERNASVWVCGRFVPYPFQRNLEALPPDIASRCRADLADAVPPHARFDNFREWIVGRFGQGIADVFMLPYNRKVWGYDPAELGYQWIGERVAAATQTTDQRKWGPNRTFRFPRRGGTGAIWDRLAAALPAGRVHVNKRACAVDVERRRVTFSDGSSTDYDLLISTLPLDVLCEMSAVTTWVEAARGLVHSSVHVVGVGIAGQVPVHLAGRSWMYFPESDCPFYRATVFSAYAPNNVPQPDRQWSLMLEVCETPARAVDAASVVQDVIDGLVATGLLTDPGDVVSTWHTRLDYGYPTPSLGRDAALDVLLPALAQRSILSRGRFGAWKYEVSNQDHSVMQGVEAVDRALLGRPESTVWEPAVVNAPGKRPAPPAP